LHNLGAKIIEEEPFLTSNYSIALGLPITGTIAREIKVFDELMLASPKLNLLDIKNIDANLKNIITCVTKKSIEEVELIDHKHKTDMSKFYNSFGDEIDETTDKITNDVPDKVIDPETDKIIDQSAVTIFTPRKILSHTKSSTETDVKSLLSAKSLSNIQSLSYIHSPVSEKSLPNPKLSSTPTLESFTVGLISDNKIVSKTRTLSSSKLIPEIISLSDIKTLSNEMNKLDQLNQMNRLDQLDQLNRLNQLDQLDQLDKNDRLCGIHCVQIKCCIL
jgi:hypothetical protein